MYVTYDIYIYVYIYLISYVIYHLIQIIMGSGGASECFYLAAQFGMRSVGLHTLASATADKRIPITARTWTTFSSGTPLFLSWAIQRPHGAPFFKTLFSFFLYFFINTIREVDKHLAILLCLRDHMELGVHLLGSSLAQRAGGSDVSQARPVHHVFLY